MSRGGPGQTERDAAGLVGLVASCGGLTITDVSPNGGRHVYVLWARPIPLSELRPVLRALGALYPSLDATPMLNAAAGCIRPPGARHRSGGHQVLTTSLADAQAAVIAPNGPAVWAALLDRLAPQLHQLAQPEPDPGEAATSGGPRRALSARIFRIAETGLYDSNRYRSPSEARQALITAAAAAGWALADVRAQLAAGAWPGAAGFYSRYRAGERQRAITRDWKKAQAHLEQRKNAPNSPTREWPHTGATEGGHEAQRFAGAPAPAATGAYGWTRSWWNAVHALERTGRWTGRAGLSVRVVLRALGAMAQMRGTRYLDVGRRALALNCGLDDSTVGAVLRVLRAEDDPVIVLLEADRGERGDLYELRIPDAALEAAAWRTWRPGRIGVHPVFRELGPAAALVYEALGADPLPRRAVTTDAALPERTVDTALRTLAEHGLAERDPNQGWRRGPADPDCLARAFGIPAILADLIERYRRERAAWRAYLDARAHRHHAEEPVGPLRWPDQLVAPATRGHDEEAYDEALKALAEDDGSFAAAIELLQRELGATTLARSG